MGPITTSPADVIAYAAWFGGSFLVLTFCVVGGVRTFYRLRRRGWRDLPGFGVAFLATLGLFMGGWLGYIPYLAVQWVRKKRRASQPQATGASSA